LKKVLIASRFRPLTEIRVTDSSRPSTTSVRDENNRAVHGISSHCAGGTPLRLSSRKPPTGKLASPIAMIGRYLPSPIFIDSFGSELVTRVNQSVRLAGIAVEVHPLSIRDSGRGASAIDHHAAVILGADACALHSGEELLAAPVHRGTVTCGGVEQE